MAGRADMINNRRRVQRALQAVGFVALLTLAVGAVLTATGVFAGGLGATASSVKPAYAAYAPILTDTTDTPTSTYTPTPTSTPNPCDPVWSVVSIPNPGVVENYLKGVAVVSANDVWAVGYSSSYTPYQTLIEHWNGTSWSVIPSPNMIERSSYLIGVGVVAANDVWAVGDYCWFLDCTRRYTLIEHWNGTAWSVVPSANVGTDENFLNGVAAVSVNDVWAVGHYYDNCGGCGTHTLIEHWDGTAWSVVASPNPTLDSFLSGVAAVFANDVWAVGYYCNSGGPCLTLTEHWNGTAWSVVSSVNPSTGNNYLYGIAAASGNDVWTVGYYYYSGSNRYQTLIEHWDGTSWQVVSSPNQGTSLSNYLYGVDVVSANDVWAVGDYFNGNAYQTLIEHWDGTSWQVVSSPSSCCGNNYLNGIAASSDNDVWAVGYNVTGSVSQTLVEHYATLCGTPTNTPTPPAGDINGHLTWQGVAAANRPSVTGTLQLCVGGSPQTFYFTTDTGGYFTVTHVLPDGTYHWRTKGGRHLSSSSPADGPDLVVTNGYATQEFGVQRGGNANSDSVVNSTDFAFIKQQFGLSGIRPADFDYNYVVNASDFNILKRNFGQAGHVLTCP